MTILALTDQKSQVVDVLVALLSRVAITTYARGLNGPDPDGCRELRRWLHDLASTAHSAGLTTYSSLSLRVAERLQPHVDAGTISHSVRELLYQWPQASLRYLRAPQDAGLAAELINLLDLTEGARRFDREEHDMLLSDLIRERNLPVRRAAC